VLVQREVVKINPPRGVGEILQLVPGGGASASSAVSGKPDMVTGECVETRSVNSSTRKGYTADVV